MLASERRASWGKKGLDGLGGPLESVEVREKGEKGGVGAKLVNNEVCSFLKYKLSH